MTTPPADAEFLALQQALSGRFSLERELGRGGMGIVYLARDVALDRPVAIKLLPPVRARDAATRERFLREARTAAALSHPNIVPIHLVEDRDGLVFFVMTWVRGETLGDRVRRSGPLEAATAARILRDVAWALAYAHGRGVIHRDVKPDNILLEQGSGRALVTDFGIARVAAEETVSGDGEVLGTVQYMSPEQADPAVRLDGRSDLYALGVTAFFALTGRLPFEAPSAAALLAMHMAVPAPPVASLRADIPAALAAAVDRCLAKTPAERFSSGEELAAALESATGTSRPLAQSVRRFQDALFSSGQQFSLIGTLLAFSVLWAPDAWKPLVVTLGALSLMPILGVVTAARAVVRDGLGIPDVADAYRSLSLVPGRTEQLQREAVARGARRLKHPAFRVIVIILAGSMIFTGVDGLLRIESWVYPSPVQVGLAHGMTILLGLGFSMVGLQLGPFRNLSRELTPAAGPRRFEVLARWIEGRVGRALFRLARLGLSRAPAADRLPAPEPTEVVLAHAIEALLAALPPAQRRAMAQVPETVRRLERQAEALRLRCAALTQAFEQASTVMGDADRREQVAAEIEARRDDAAERLALVVRALENLRLDMLRVRAGVAAATDVTAALEAARRAGDAVDAVLDAAGSSG